VPIHDNLVDLAWGAGRPAAPDHKVVTHPIEFSGKAHHEKLKDLQDHIKEKGAYGIVVSALDEIAWVFNLRGSDIECNPVFVSYAIITQDEAVLYVNPDKVTQQVQDHLGGHVLLKPYADFFNELRKLAPTLRDSKKKLITDSKTSLAVEVAVGEVSSDARHSGLSLVTVSPHFNRTTLLMNDP
jgi:Xaa-Pro aminopeptidase